jgi:hypothetical protein
MNTKSNAQKIPWNRLLVEGIAIVVSILLAFWIDAYWQSRLQVEQGRRLAEALVSEIAENDEMLVIRIAASRELAARARALLTLMASVNHDGQDIQQIRDIGNVFVMVDWDPDTDVYEQAVASGQLLLIDDANLRFELTGYHSQLDSVGDIVENIRTQYYLELEPFLARNTVYTDVAHSNWLEGIPAPPFSTDVESLSTNPELWNWIALRLENEVARVAYLERAQTAGNDLRESLLKYLN